MHEMMELPKYLILERKKIEALEKPLALLERIKIPLRVSVYEKAIDLYSSDYSLATGFKIKKRSKSISSYSCPDGGYSRELIEYFPQFYFILEKKQVLIQHKGFETDKRIVVKSIDHTQGWKEYSDETKTAEDYIDTKKAISFFEKKGVKKSLLKTLEERIEEL